MGITRIMQWNSKCSMSHGWLIKTLFRCDGIDDCVGGADEVFAVTLVFLLTPILNYNAMSDNNNNSYCPLDSDLNCYQL